jgi:Sigma-70 region 2
MASVFCGVFRGMERFHADAGMSQREVGSSESNRSSGNQGNPTKFSCVLEMRWIVSRELSSGRDASYPRERPWSVKPNLERPAPHADRLLSSSVAEVQDFPKPRGAEGARVFLTAEERALAVRYLPLARHLSRRLYETSTIRPEDLHATACMALAEAARNYDPSRNVGFGTYARHRIRAALRVFSDCLPVAPRYDHLADRG